MHTGNSHLICIYTRTYSYKQTKSNSRVKNYRSPPILPALVNPNLGFPYMAV